MPRSGSARAATPTEQEVPATNLVFLEGIAGGPGGTVPRNVIEDVFREMATEHGTGQRTSWTMDGHRWQPNHRVRLDSVYDIGGVGLPPFE
eukprot:7313590-Heterocapsa_arctica.AAC.1